MARRSDEREAARAEYMAQKKKGGEVNLRQLADDLHLKYDTVRRWKSKDGWDTPTGRKPGGQPGNQNAAGNSGGGAPAGNLNAEKDGAYSRIFFDKLTPAEQRAFDDAPRNGVEALQHEMGLLKLRELKILEKIKEYEDMDPDTLITSSVLDMRVPGKVGKTGKKEDGKVQTMGMYSRDTPFARILKLQDALYKTQGRIAAVAGALRAAEEADRRMELERQRLELLRIRATGEVPEGGDEDGSIHQFQRQHLRLKRKETPKTKGGKRRASVQTSDHYRPIAHREVEKGRDEDTRDSGEAEGQPLHGVPGIETRKL